MHLSLHPTSFLTTYNVSLISSITLVELLPFVVNGYLPHHD